MRMMRQASGFLCAEEWSDFVDADGQTSSQLKSYLHGRILKTLKSFFTDNCPEADAFTYLGINLQYVRMLAEFSRDEEIRKPLRRFINTWWHSCCYLGIRDFIVPILPVVKAGRIYVPEI